MTIDNTGKRLASPSAARNREPILAVLNRVLPAAGLVLEIASGGGEHAAFFGERLPGVVWQPSDPDPVARASIAAWRDQAGLANLRPALEIDAAAGDWGAAEDMDVAAMFCANMIHISPWASCLGLLAGAGRILEVDGVLVLYGPYKRGGRHTAESNAAFDQGLRQRNPAWGVRDLDDVARAAEAQGLALVEAVEMPANNLTVVFRRD